MTMVDKELRGNIGHSICMRLFEMFKDSRDVGAILNVAVATFLIQAPTKEHFEEHKRAMIEGLQLITFQEREGN